MSNGIEIVDIEIVEEHIWQLQMLTRENHEQTLAKITSPNAEIRTQDSADKKK
jgi:hypothetical protein